MSVINKKFSYNNNYNNYYSAIFNFNFIICIILFILNTTEAAISNRGNKPQTSGGPKFLSRGHTHRTVVGDTLVLPCQVENLEEPYKLLWRRGSDIISAASIMIQTDTRFRLLDHYDLQIQDVEPQDAGDYVCQINTRPTKDLVHTVEILEQIFIESVSPARPELTNIEEADLENESSIQNFHENDTVQTQVPPSVKAIPQTGQVTARKGGAVTLECKASGNPVPTIYWTKKSGNGKSSARIGEGPILTLEKVERSHAGVYQCTAENNVGVPVTLDMRLDVLYPPDISVEKSWVHSGEGFEAQLVCIVHADPQALVSWFQNSFPLQQTDRRAMTSRGNRHTLNMRPVQPEDFGNYSCVADNTLGRSRKYMEVSGRPGPAEFHSAPWSRSPDSYNLTWKVESYPPLQEVRLLYRKLMMNDTFQQPGRWHDVILTPAPRQSTEPPSHPMSFTLRGLQPGSVYEAIVQAKNRYGWNEVSDIFQFYTQRSADRIEDMELVASSTSRNKSNSIKINYKCFFVLLKFIIILFIHK